MQHTSIDLRTLGLGLAVAVLSGGCATTTCPPGASSDSLFCHSPADAGTDRSADVASDVASDVSDGAAVFDASDASDASDDASDASDGTVQLDVSDAGDVQSAPDAPAAPCADAAVGATCGTDRVCSSAGTCVECRAGMSCRATQPCRTATIACGTGEPVCGDTGNQTAGAACPGGVCDGNGACLACTSGMACVPSNPCRTGALRCSPTITCMEMGNQAAGAMCPGGVCNGSGTCVPCMAGASCTSSNPCRTASLVCASGAPVCTDSGNRAAGTACPGGVCNSAGACVACAAGAVCSPAVCRTGSISCSTGSPVCIDMGPTPLRTPCGAGSVCDGAGRCVEQTFRGTCTLGPPATSAEWTFSAVYRPAAGNYELSVGYAMQPNFTPAANSGSTTNATGDFVWNYTVTNIATGVPQPGMGRVQATPSTLTGTAANGMTCAASMTPIP